MIDNNKFDLLYYKYDKCINWNISGFGNDMILFMILSYIKYLKNNNINNPIKTIHGSYLSKYNGGRISLFNRPFEYVKNKIKEINNLGIGVKLTFSNIHITKEMASARYLLLHNH